MSKQDVSENDSPTKVDGIIEESIQSKGGKARALNLTSERRKEIASAAAATKWKMPKVTHKGSLELSGLDLPCYVLEDGRRVLSGRAMQEALLMVDSGAKGQSAGTRLSRYLTQESLKSFIFKGKLPDHYEPIECLNGTAKINGFEATILVDVCEAFLEARNSKKLSSRQAIIAKRCEILITAFAKTGIIALVDEATGYQADRQRDELAKILQNFISEDYQKWTRTFPLEFYMEIARLKGWAIKERGRGYIWPQVVGHYTNDFVYSRLAPGILDELRVKNPKRSGKRQQKHHQWLTGDIGHPRLMAHLEGLKMIMRYCDTWEQFEERVDQEYPAYIRTEMGFEIKKIKPKRSSLEISS